MQEAPRKSLVHLCSLLSRPDTESRFCATTGPPHVEAHNEPEHLLLLGTAFVLLLAFALRFACRLQHSAITRLIAPLFLLGRTLGVAGVSPKVSKELHALARALSQLLQGVLQRAAEEASVLPAGETVQRVSAVASALVDWGRRGITGPAERFVPLLLLAQPDGVGLHDDDGGPSKGTPTRGSARDVGAGALAAALQRSGAPPLPQELLTAAADMLEASAAAAAHGLQGGELSLQEEVDGSDLPLVPQQKTGEVHKPAEQQQREQPRGAEGSTKAPADELRQLVAANASWLPIYYLLMRLNGGIWLPALQLLAEAVANQETRLIQLFLSQQQQQQQQGIRGTGPAIDEACPSAWGAVGRLLYGEVQQLSVSLARIHSLRPLRGMRRFAAAAVAFDRFLSSLPSDGPTAAAAAGAAIGAGAGTASPLLRPLLHTRESPRDLKEVEKRIRFFCSLVTLGASGHPLAAGVSACLPSESQLHTLAPLELHQEQKSQQKGHFPSLGAAEACARHIPLQLLQRLLVSCSWIDEIPLVCRSLRVLRLRIETLTLNYLMRLHAASPYNNDKSSSSRRHGLPAEASAAANERCTAELVGKTLALLHKSMSGPSRNRPGGEKGTHHPSSSSSTWAPEDSTNEGPSRLREALCGLASAATLWAAVTGFERQSPEDIALLTFSLIPFWLQNAAAGAIPVHAGQHVQQLRAAAVATRNHQEPQLQQRRQEEPPQGELTEQQIAELARCVRGVKGFFPGPGVAAPRVVNSAAVEVWRFSSLSNDPPLPCQLR